ncbi:MAG: YgfZ/GcvT domain-containing protein [Opitutales bacterium]
MIAIALRQKPGALLRITGEDAFAYLQSQFSNDLRRDGGSDGAVTYGLWLDRKGRVRADSFLLQLDEESFLALSHHCEAAALAEHIQAHIIADDVEVEAVEGEVVSLFAPDEAGVPFTLPQRGRFAQDASLGAVFHGRMVHGVRLECVRLDGPVQLPDTVEEVRAEDFEAAVYEGRGAAVPAECGQEGDLPQEAGLEVDAISFTKGCYLGQEVMARLQAMGQVRRKLVGLRGNGQPLEDGQALFAREREVGTVRSVHPQPEKAVVQARAMIKLAHLPASQRLSLQADSDACIEVL